MPLNDSCCVFNFAAVLIDGSVELAALDNIVCVMVHHASQGNSMTSLDPKPVVAPSHVAWGSIELLHNVVRTLQYLEEQGTPKPSVLYRAKIKLHGTNAAVQCHTTGVFPQSRSQVLTGSADNNGFAAWCGPGVQQGMAITGIDRKVFAVFAMTDSSGVLEVCPQELRKRLPKHPDLFVIPWHGDAVTINYADNMDEAVAVLNQMVEAVEEEDPWVKATFGVSGLGEGIVLYPQLGDSPLDSETFAQLGFKAKGLKHRTAKNKKAAQVAPEKVAGVEEFVSLVVTDARLEQGVAEACNGEFNMRTMGDFIRWTSSDVKKESALELEAAGLSWKQVSKDVTQKAREWYRSKCGL